MNEAFDKKNKDNNQKSIKIDMILKMTYVISSYVCDI